MLQKGAFKMLISFAEFVACAKLKYSQRFKRLHITTVPKFTSHLSFNLILEEKLMCLLKKYLVIVFSITCFSIFVFMGTVLAQTPNMGEIVFISNRDGNSELYSMNSDGSNQKRESSNDVFDDNPVWSWDGEFVFFNSNRHHPGISSRSFMDVYAINQSNGRVRRITDTNSVGYCPAISPDNNKIATTVFNRETYEFDIFILNIDQSNPRRIPLSSDEGDLCWDPQNEFLLFESNIEGNWDIFCLLLNKPRAMFKKLFDSKENENDPVWSPDGKKIAYSSNASGNSNIYIIDRFGTKENIRQITFSSNNNGNNKNPSFSPDGKYIVFESDRNGNLDIYSIKTDGTKIKQLTTNKSDDSSPCWRPKK